MRDKLADIIHHVNPKTKDIGVTDGADLVSDLGLDSYDRIEIVLATEAAYDIEIDEEKDFATVRTFAHFVELVEKKVRENGLKT